MGTEGWIGDGDNETTVKAVFNENSAYWHNDADYNRVFLQAQQNYFNHLLKARGHVFLNEIFDALGLNRTTEGQISGWLAGEGNTIDFGITFYDKSTSIGLVFNVQGVIYEDIE